VRQTVFSVHELDVNERIVKSAAEQNGDGLDMQLGGTQGMML